MISFSFYSFCSAIKSSTTEVGRSNNSLSPTGVVGSWYDFYYFRQLLSSIYCFYFSLRFFACISLEYSSVMSWAEYSSLIPTESIVILPVSPRSLLLFISKLAVTFFSVIIFFVAKRCWERWDSWESWRSLFAFCWLMSAYEFDSATRSFWPSSLWASWMSLRGWMNSWFWIRLYCSVVRWFVFESRTSTPVPLLFDLCFPCCDLIPFLLLVSCFTNVFDLWRLNCFKWLSVLSIIPSIFRGSISPRKSRWTPCLKFDLFPRTTVFLFLQLLLLGGSSCNEFLETPVWWFLDILS